MLVAVADTHAVLWYLFADPRLSSRARQVIEAAAAAGDHVGLSSITLIEMVYLIEKGRIASESFSRLAAVTTDLWPADPAQDPDLFSATLRE